MEPLTVKEMEKMVGKVGHHKAKVATMLEIGQRGDGDLGRGNRAGGVQGATLDALCMIFKGGDREGDRHSTD